MDKIVESLKFKHIETEAMLRGRKIISTYSYRTPVDIYEYRRIDRALVRAFGCENTRTIGTPADFKISTRGEIKGLL
jgi:hypothetical protein